MRFPGFEGEWEEKRLGELLEFKNGINASKEQYGKGIKFINVLDILNNDFITYEKIVGQVDVDEATVKKYSVKYGDILFQRSSETREEVGTANVYLDEKRTATFGGFVIRGRKIGDYDPGFFNKLLKTDDARDSITSKSGGSTRYNVGQEVLSSIQLVFPPLIEQQKVGRFLSLIDDRIQTQSKIIQCLESLIIELKESLFTQKLRFPEFKEKWLKYKVSDLLDFFPTNSLSWIQLDYNSNTLHNLHYGIIHQGKSGQLDMNIYKLPCIKGQFIPKNYILCEDGDIAFADASEDTNDVAKAVELLNCEERKVVCGLHTIHGRDKLGITVNGFKGFAFNTKFFRQQIRQLAQGTKVFSISAKTFRECFIDIPSKEEQLKITELLSSLNNKLDIESKVLRELRIQKQYLLQKLFI